MAAREDIRGRIIGNSPVFKEVLERAERAAKAPTKIRLYPDFSSQKLNKISQNEFNFSVFWLPPKSEIS
jgi:hypothetical protein